MSELEPVRPCICGRFWGLDLSQPHELTCLCGETLYSRQEGEGWFVQHGHNPEHRSPNYTGGSLVEVCDWVDSVCLEARHE